MEKEKAYQGGIMSNDLQADCKLYFENMDDYLDEIISPGFRTEMEKHMAECESCRIRMETYQETIDLLGSAIMPEPPDALLTSLKKALSATRVDFDLDSETMDPASPKEAFELFDDPPSSASGHLRKQSFLSWKNVAVSVLLIVFGAAIALAATWTAGYLKFDRDDSLKERRPLQKTESIQDDESASPDETHFQKKESPEKESDDVEDPDTNQKEKLLKEPSGDYHGRRKTSGTTEIRARPVDESEVSTSSDPAANIGVNGDKTRPDKEDEQELINLLRQKRLNNRVHQDEKLQKQLRIREQTRERNGLRDMHDERGGKTRIRGGRRGR